MKFWKLSNLRLLNLKRKLVHFLPNFTHFCAIFSIEDKLQLSKVKPAVREECKGDSLSGVQKIIVTKGGPGPKAERTLKH
jgi:hypothetical protein